ncbi:hypothetical protein CRYUN_Cryun14cG0017500 [Craigia yunnanensis]
MEHTAEQQQYQQQYQYQQAYEYDPSQYDQSAAYYAYANQQQQQYQYYPPQDSYSQQFSQFYQEAAPIHPPGVPLDLPALHNQPTVYYPQQPAVQHQLPLVIPVSGSDSAVSTANFVGNMDMVQRGNPPPQMQTAYRGGRRGGRPFRGGSRGYVGNRGLRSDGSALPHNRSHGHSGSRHFASKGVTSAIPNSVLDPSGAAAVMPTSASVPGQATLAAQVPVAPPRMAWCELCRVDCSRPEILEQHKNGKRHKKNLQVHEELQKLNRVITGQQSVQVPNSGSEVVQLEKFEGSAEKQHQQKTLPSLAASKDKKKKTEQQKDIVNKSEASTSDPAEAKRKLRDPSEARARGFKRKMRGSRGGKYMKSNEGPRRPVEPPKLKGGIPFICELCNVKCESQVVFNSHLAGKKHVANLKRFHGDRALYGEAGLQALYPPNFNVPSPSLIPQIQQGLTDPQVVLAQLLTYVLSQAQVPGLAPPQVSLPATIPLSSLENQYPHQFTQGSLATSEMRREMAVKAEAETWQHSSATKSEALSFAGNNKAESRTSESEKNEVSQQQSFTAKFEVPATAGTDVKVENGAFDLENKAEVRREVAAKADAETWQHSSATKSEASSFAGNNKAESQTSETKKNEVSQQQSFTAKFEVPATAGTDVKVENGAFDLENKAEVRREVVVKAEAETWQHSSATKSEASSCAGNNKAESQTSESEKNEVSQQQSFTAKFEVPATAGTDVKMENGAFDLENMAVIRSMDNPIFATLEYLATGGKPLLPSTSEKDTRTECKTVSLDAIDESVSNVNLEEPEEDPEEEVDEPEEDPEEEVGDDLEEQNE